MLSEVLGVQLLAVTYHHPPTAYLQGEGLTREHGDQGAGLPGRHLGGQLSQAVSPHVFTLLHHCAAMVVVEFGAVRAEMSQGAYFQDGHGSRWAGCCLWAKARLKPKRLETLGSPKGSRWGEFRENRQRQSKPADPLRQVGSEEHALATATPLLVHLFNSPRDVLSADVFQPVLPSCADKDGR